MTPAVSSFHSAKAGLSDRCRESSSQPHRCGGLRGREPSPRAGGELREPGQCSLPQVVAAIGYGICVFQLCFQSCGEFANEAKSCAPKAGSWSKLQYPCVNYGAKSVQRGEIKLIKNPVILVTPIATQSKGSHFFISLGFHWFS